MSGLVGYGTSDEEDTGDTKEAAWQDVSYHISWKDISAAETRLSVSDRTDPRLPRMTHSRLQNLTLRWVRSTLELIGDFANASDQMGRRMEVCMAPSR